MRLGHALGGASILSALAVATTLTATPAAAQDPIERGRYLVTIMSCTDCHTGGQLMGQPDPARFLAGSEVGFRVPGAGTFYPPNLTSDVETGLGSWSEEDIIRALTTGVRPDGRQLFPIMPWMNLAHLTDEDAQAVAAYLKSLPPVSFQAPANVGPDAEPTSPYMMVIVP